MATTTTAIGINLPTRTVTLVPAGPDRNGLYGFVVKEFADGVYSDDGVDTDTSGLLIAHDILDHAVSAGKTLVATEDELWAVGCAYWMRRSYGDITDDGIAGDVDSVLRDWIWRDEQITRPETPSDEAMEVIADCLREPVDRYMLDEIDDMIEHSKRSREEMLEAIDLALLHLGRGYDAAMEYYADDYLATTMFQQILSKVKDASDALDFEFLTESNRGLPPDLGYRLELTLEFDRTRVTSVFHDPDYDEIFGEEEEDEAELELA